MKKLVQALVLTGLVGVPTVAMAADAPASPFSANITLTSDYLFRGVSQTTNKPAIQGGFDYAHPSGFYVGTWASNVDWVTTKDNTSMEIDLYAGYAGSLPAGLGYDVGAITYYYPGNKIAGEPTPDTTEVYVSGSWEFLTLKYSHTVSKYFVAWEGANGEKTRGSGYLELNAEYDLGGGWGVSGHVGRQKVKNYSAASYTDWNIGVSKDIGFGTVALTYSDTNAKDSEYTWGANDDKKVADGRVFVSFSKEF
ncbi:MAG: TorF family putative porin [Rubrivivax sp.]|nr:TorF family putative porin [Rubrivivax sp.]